MLNQATNIKELVNEAFVWRCMTAWHRTSRFLGLGILIMDRGSDPPTTSTQNTDTVINACSERDSNPRVRANLERTPYVQLSISSALQCAETQTASLYTACNIGHTEKLFKYPL